MSIGPFDFTISDKDAAGNTMTLTGNVKITRATATPVYDAFGTKMIYPTKASGQVKNITMSAPSSGLRSHFNGATFAFTNGVWRVSPDGSGLGRSGLNSDAGNKWVNVEATFYAKYVSGDRQIQIACMGGVHDPAAPRWGSAYKVRILGTPAPTSLNHPNKTFFVKEMAHGAYCEPQMGIHGGIAKLITTPVPDYNFAKWQGYKLCKYEIEDTTVPVATIGRHPVVLEFYVDANCQTTAGVFQRKNNWKLVNTWIDRGLWSAATSSIWNDTAWIPVDKDNTTGLRKPNEIINTGGEGYNVSEQTINDVYIRTDGNTIYDLRDFSVREIDAAEG